MNAREVSLKILLEYEKAEAYSNLLLDSELKKTELSDLDKAFVTKLVYGVITYIKTLDYIISKLSKVKIKKISKPIINILRLGLYQMYYLDKIPTSAVSLTHKLSFNSFLAPALIRLIEYVSTAVSQ